MGDIPVLGDDTLKALGLSRLRLLAVLIELEDEFAIEFPADATDGFRVVEDIAFYIQSHEMTPYDDDADEPPAAARQPIKRRPSARDCLHRVCARAVGRVLGRVFGFVGLAPG
jgi:acyl carrier protein